MASFIMSSLISLLEILSFSSSGSFPVSLDFTTWTSAAPEVVLFETGVGLASSDPSLDKWSSFASASSDALSFVFSSSDSANTCYNTWPS
jgi:hypothetical protein